MFDPILRRFARSHPCVALRHQTTLESFEQDAGGVRATVVDRATGRREEIHARYMVGCDGAGSLVRERLGIRLLGTPVLTYTTNVIFRAAGLDRLHGRAPGYRFILYGPEGTWATLVAIDGRDQWRFSIIGSSHRREWSPEEIQAAIRRAVGAPFDYEIVSIVPWTRRELVAETFRSGRVFIAGDAAHMMSPTGGFGMNTGIGDAIGLAWQLTAQLEGWGGEGLLDAYTVERRPVAERNVSEASGNLARMCSIPPTPELWDDTAAGAVARARIGAHVTEVMKREWFTLGIHLGYRYDGSPVIWPDGSPAPADDVSRYQQTARPGARAPHVWLQGGFPSGRSTLDLFGRGFVLLDFGGTRAGSIASSRAVEAAQARGIPLAVHAIDHVEARAVYESRLVLVRPDGHTCWRGDTVPADIRGWLDRVAGHV